MLRTNANSPAPRHRDVIKETPVKGKLCMDLGVIFLGQIRSKECKSIKQAMFRKLSTHYIYRYSIV